MRRTLALSAAIILGLFPFVLPFTILLAVDPLPAKLPTPGGSVIKFPDAPMVEPTPTDPKPGPAILTLTQAEWYIITADVDCFVLTSPQGRVKVTDDAGPLKLKGKFIDGSGKVETRTFREKHVFTVEAVASGRVEIIVIPAGATTDADVQRRTVDVNAGQAPQPPPEPCPVPPGPTPPAPTPNKADKVWFIVVEETANRTPALGKLLADPWWKKTLEAKGHGWRKYDKDDPTAIRNNYVTQLGIDMIAPPALIVLDQKGGMKPLKTTSLTGKTPADLDAILKEVTP